MKDSYILILVLFCWIGQHKLKAGDIYFHKVTTSQGLSHNTVYSIVQDHKGFMWFGTREGLNRFDSDEIITYYANHNDSLSLGSNHITALQLGSDSLLYIGTANGLHIYDDKKGVFRRIEHEGKSLGHHDNGKGQDIDLGKIRSFIQDDNSPYLLIIAQNQPHTPWNRGNSSDYDPQKLNVPPYMVDTERTRNDLVAYYSEITYADSLLGVCIDYIDRSGKDGNTMVIFTSEQGSGFPFAKWTCYDLGLKTSFIIKWPGTYIARNKK